MAPVTTQSISETGGSRSAAISGTDTASTVMLKPAESSPSRKKPRAVIM